MPDTAPAPFLFHQGTAPLLISMPHAIEGIQQLGTQ